MRALRLLPLLALTGLVLLAAPASATTPAPAAASASVAAPAPAAQDGGEATIVDFDCSPRRLTVEAGTKVTWTNTGERPHTATDRGAPSTPSRSPPETAPRSR